MKEYEEVLKLGFISVQTTMFGNLKGKTDSANCVIDRIRV